MTGIWSLLRWSSPKPRRISQTAIKTHTITPSAMKNFICVPPFRTRPTSGLSRGLSASGRRTDKNSNHCTVQPYMPSLRDGQGPSEQRRAGEDVNALPPPRWCSFWANPTIAELTPKDSFPSLWRLLSRSSIVVDVLRGDLPPTTANTSCQRTSPLSHGSVLSQASFTIIITGLLTPASRLNGLKPYGRNPPNGPTPVGWGVAEAAWLAAGSNGQNPSLDQCGASVLSFFTP